MQRLCNTLFFNFSNAGKYIIKDLKYLIEAPPPKPASSFIRFITSFTKGQTGGLPVNLIAKEKSREWKAKTAEEKAAFNGPQSEKENYQKLRAEYEKKYVIPFNRLNGRGQLVKSLYQNGVVKIEKANDIKEHGKAIQQALKTIPPQEVQKYKEIAEKGNAERQKLVSKFQFPHKQFKTQAGYSRAHPTIPLHLRASEFQKYEENWEKSVDQWLKANKYEMDIKTFLKKYRAEEKLLKVDAAIRDIYSSTKNQDQAEYVLNDKLDIKERFSAKRTVTGAKRVHKKPISISQTLVNKRKKALGIELPN